MKVVRNFRHCALFSWAAFALVYAGCGDEEIRVQIVSPTTGAVVTSPVTLVLEVSGVAIHAATAGIDGAAHYHVFVDQPPVAEGQMIPFETAGVFHFSTLTAVLELTTGVHSLTVVLGDNEHARLADAAISTIDVMVE